MMEKVPMSVRSPVCRGLSRLVLLTAAVSLSACASAPPRDGVLQVVPEAFTDDGGMPAEARWWQEAQTERVRRQCASEEAQA